MDGPAVAAGLMNFGYRMLWNFFPSDARPDKHPSDSNLQKVGEDISESMVGAGPTSGISIVDERRPKEASGDLMRHYQEPTVAGKP
jgi:hypothetical protein